MNTETIDRLFLELSQVTTATTANELAMRQQLDEKEEQRQNLMDAFARQGNSAQEVITELRQQLASQGEALAAALVAIKLKDKAFELIALDDCCTSPAPIAQEALAIQPNDSALKDKAMTTYEQPKDWIERHLVEDPGGLLACEPSRLDTLNDELQLARQANEAQHQQLAAALAVIKVKDALLTEMLLPDRDWPIMDKQIVDALAIQPNLDLIAKVPE